MEVEKKEYFQPTIDGKYKLHMIMWKPAQVKAVLQIVHGMMEYIDRYSDFAYYLAERGILVVGNDHLGHGKTATKKEEYGYFCEGEPSSVVVDNLHHITELMKQEYRDVPYFILGHSMGSFLTRRYIMTYGKDVDGCLILGTGKQEPLMLRAGILLVHTIAFFKGDHYHSPLVLRLSMGDYNDQFEPIETPNAWVTKDLELQRKYTNDSLCDFTFSLNGFMLLMHTIHFIQKKKHINQIPKELPIIFASGDKDPVGANGKWVKEVYEEYKAAGIEDVTLKLYPDDRHELINETDRLQVFEDLYQWIAAECEKKCK